MHCLPYKTGSCRTKLVTISTNFHRFLQVTQVMHQKLRTSKLSPGLAPLLLNPFVRNWLGKPLSYFAAWFNHSQATLPLWSAKQSKSLSVSQPPPLSP